MKKFAALIILGLMFSSLAFGRVPPALSAPITVRAAANVHELTAADVEAFLDGIVPLQLDRVASALPNREDIAGAIGDLQRRCITLTLINVPVQRT